MEKYIELGDNEEPDFMFKYYPYHHGENPQFDGNSQNIINIKNPPGDSYRPGAVKFFHSLVSKLTKKNVVVCIVPSSDPIKTDTGLNELANIIVNEGLWLNGTKCLRRTKKIPKAANGGPRNIRVHLDSIVVENKNNIKGKDVFLLDDVTTSGSSLKACKILLMKAGANSVQMYALGKTN